MRTSGEGMCAEDATSPISLGRTSKALTKPEITPTGFALFVRISSTFFLAKTGVNLYLQAGEFVLASSVV
jgi:hypothetical protein